MGYACPVCEDPQADAVHLANHVAFTALTRGGDHEAWLEDHLPGWDEHGESWLADRIVEYAAEADFPQVFEDTTDRSGGHRPHQHGGHHDHEHGGPSEPGSASERARERNRTGVPDIEDGDVAEILARAREMTRERNPGTDEESETE